MMLSRSYVLTFVALLAIVAVIFFAYPLAHVPGTALAAPAAPGLPDVLSDGEFVFGPNVGDFKVSEYLERRGSVLAKYADNIESWAAYASVNPRVILTLLELKTGLVTATRLPEGGLDKALGYPEADVDSQIKALTLDLATAFYRHLYSSGARRPASAVPPATAVLTFRDGAVKEFAGKASAGSYAVASVLAGLESAGDWATLAGDGAESGFVSTYRALFPGSDPLSSANSITPNSLPPSGFFQFPFPVGETWSFNGPHNWNGDGTVYGRPYSSMDFWVGGGSCFFPPSSYAAAARGGNAIHPSGYSCWLRIDHGGGWTTSYYHLTKTIPNSAVDRNDSLGQIACANCAGVRTTTPQVTFSLMYNGAFVDLDGVQLSYWTIHEGTGSASTGYLERDTAKKSANGTVLNDYDVYVPASHLECQAGMCVRVGGAGPDACGPEQSECAAPVGTWVGYFYDGTTLSGVPKCTREYTAPINENWGSTKPCPELASASSWSARFKGTFHFDNATYYFYLNHDNGARLFGPGPVSIYDNWAAAGSGWTAGTVLNGDVPLTLEFKSTGSARLEIKWAKEQLPAVPGLPRTPANGALVSWEQRGTQYLSWTGNAAEYFVEIWSELCDPVTIGPIAGTSVNPGAVVPGYTYFWRVKAHNSAGDSAWTETWTFKLRPPAPTNLQATVVSCARIDLAWTDNSNVTDGYRIYRNGALLVQLDNGADPILVYTDTAVMPGTQYSYSVRSLAMGTESDPSPTATVTTDACVPAPPQLTSPANGAQIVEGQAVTLAWNPSGPQGTYYSCEVLGGPQTVTVDWQTATSKLLGALPVGYEYTWHCKARVGVTESIWSPDRKFTVKPLAPTGLVATVISCSQINLTWTYTGTNQDGFKIYRDGVYIAQVAANRTSFEDTALLPTTPYSYDVRAFRKAVESTPSNSVTATTLTGCSGVTVERVWTAMSSTVETTVFRPNQGIWLGISAENNTGEPGDAVWSWAVYNSVGTKQESLSHEATMVAMPPGPTELTWGSTIPYALPDGVYTFVGTVQLGAESDSKTMTFTVASALPMTPSNPRATWDPTTSPTVVTLSFVADGANEFSVQVWDSNRTLIYSPSPQWGPGNSWGVPGLTAGTYYWKGYARNGTGTVEGPEWTFTIQPLPPPPSTCLAESAHPYANNYNNTWTLTNPDTAATYTRIHFSRLETANSYDKVIVRNSAGTQVDSRYGTLADIWSNPVAGRTVQIQLTTDSTLTAWGFCVDKIETTSAPRPNAPGGLTAKPVRTWFSMYRMELGWQDNSNNETEFRIERKTGTTGTYTEIATAGADATSYTNTGLSASRTYCYRVRACNEAGCSGYSNEACATTQ